MDSVRKQSRLSETRGLAPWVAAESLSLMHLYWLPVSGFPMTHDEKRWYSEFLLRFAALLQERASLRAELFLQYKTVEGDLLSSFLKYRRKCFTKMGMVRQPGAIPPPFPTGAQIAEAVKDDKPVDLNSWGGGYCYWFLNKRPEEQRELFGGVGGMLHLFMPPDKIATVPKLPFTPALRAAHPAFQKFDVDGALQASAASADPFLAKSKLAFGNGLEDLPQYDGLKFVLPLLSSSHFLSANPEQLEAWFAVFKVYVIESPPDKGILLAFRDNYEDVLTDTLESMEQSGLRYGHYL